MIQKKVVKKNAKKRIKLKEKNNDTGSKGVIIEDELQKAKKEIEKPICFGDYEDQCAAENYHCNVKGSCLTQKENTEKFKKDKSKEEKKVKNELKKIRLKEKLEYRVKSFFNFISHISSVSTWVKFIQKFESLATVIFIDLLMLFLLGAVMFSIYFLYIKDWKMCLSSIAVFLGIAFVLDRSGKGDEGSLSIGDK